MKARTRRLSLKPSNKTRGGNFDIVLMNSQKQTALSKMEEGGGGGGAD